MSTTPDHPHSPDEPDHPCLPAAPSSTAPRTHGSRLLPIGWMTLGLAGVLYVAGSNIGSGWVIILTAAMTAALLVDLLAVWRVHRRTTVEQWLPASATTTRPAPIRWTVSRPDLGTTLHLSDAAQDIRTVVHAPEATVESTMAVARGHHTQAVAVARTVGPLGLAHATAVHTEPVVLWCRPGALPASSRLRALLGANGDPSTDHPATDRARRGEEDVRGVREFTSADPRRSVHWRATARQGRLMVRELEASQGTRLRIGIAGGTWTAPSLDLAVEVVASIAEEAVRQGHTAEVLLEGAAHPWDEETWHRLAGLPPAIGVGLRPLAVSAEPAALWLQPVAEGILAGGAPLHDRAEVAGWLRSPR